MTMALAELFFGGAEVGEGSVRERVPVASPFLLLISGGIAEVQARSRLRSAWSNWSGRCVLVAIAFTLCTFISSPAFSSAVLQCQNASNDMPESTSIAPRLFAQPLQLIRKLKLSVWSLNRLVAAVRSTETNP